MSDVKTTNIPSMSVGAMTTLLSDMYSTAIGRGLPAASLPAVMLWGPPGVGKSQAVRAIADEIKRTTGKKTKVTDVRLLLFNPIDLRGIPTANEDKTLAVWLRPKIFDMDPSAAVVNILFLDEISAAPTSVQAAAYQIALDRTVGEHRLPDNCIVIAAGNRVTDRSVAYKMPKALANRLLHIEVEGQLTSWRQWAVSHDIHPMVTGFLGFRQNYLMVFEANNDDLAFPTPRTWEMVSRILKSYKDEIESVFPLIAGLVGVGVALEFRTWCSVFNTLPEMEDIFDGKPCPIPREASALYALTAAMAAYAREHRTQLDRIAASIRYADRLPPDFSAMLLRDYMYLEKGFRDVLLKRVPEFTKWLNAKGKLLNGNI